VIVQRLWQACGIADVLSELVARRRFDFAVGRALFLTVLHRLVAPGSDRAAERWGHDYAIPGVDSLELHYLYRAMAWLGTPLPAHQQAGASRFAPRTTKDLVEEALFARRRDLFSRLDLVFFDTTSLYFHGRGRRHPRPAWPLAGSSARSATDGGRPGARRGGPSGLYGAVAGEYDRRHDAHLNRGSAEADVSGREVCVVADRGMISAKTIEALEERGWSYILGVRMRSSNEAQAIAESDEGTYRTVFPRRQRAKDQAPLRVKQIWREDRRYLVCLNADEATKDRHDREAIVAALQAALAQGDKSLIGNKGFRRFVKTQGTRFAIDEAKVADARYDGKWVLRTNTTLAMEVVALAYKHLWMVEGLFRSPRGGSANRRKSASLRWTILTPRRPRAGRIPDRHSHRPAKPSRTATRDAENRRFSGDSLNRPAPSRVRR
jgi:hypothetical protein